MYVLNSKPQWQPFSPFAPGVITFLPCFLMILFNSLTIKTLLKSSAIRRKPEGANNKDGAAAEAKTGNGEANGSGAHGDAAPTKSLLRSHSQTPDISRSITIMCVSVTMLFVVFQTPYLGECRGFRVRSMLMV